jgi:hypothetical protein
MSTVTLYTHYLDTTFYNKYTERYTINRECNAELAPIIRFHLAQLRDIQMTTHKVMLSNLLLNK